MDVFETNFSMRILMLFALVDLAWLASVVVRKRAYVPVEAECVRTFPEGGLGSSSMWRFEFEGQTRVVNRKLTGCFDRSDRKVGDRRIVYVNPRNPDRALTPQTDGCFKVFGVMFLVVAAIVTMPLWLR
ncbi:hypothetical protein B5F40_10130 [Gordonibacter sp. An230]|uniref:DUF3592 domain-containing protein n=1 Tax=Gordonibacter sp. An230 TaxID=1965592 RepID=UPI000B368391|nr:DUF3592 domain-containing protein [Gordonibacter sp. An230]OUO89587.1 hypothetical protein B5F40_10130 [Gordonibacter sp. An230]